MCSQENRKREDIFGYFSPINKGFFFLSSGWFHGSAFPTEWSMRVFGNPNKSPSLWRVLKDSSHARVSAQSLRPLLVARVTILSVFHSQKHYQHCRNALLWNIQA